MFTIINNRGISLQNLSNQFNIRDNTKTDQNSNLIQSSACNKTGTFFVSAVQNERQPRNTATIRPETLRDMSAEQERALREAAVAVGVFG